MTASELEQAMAERAYVTVVRRKGWQETDGYVAAVDRSWFALVLTENAGFGGVAVLRVEDARDLRPAPHPALARRVLKHAGQWPPRVPDALDLTDARSVAFTSGSLCRVLSLAEERRKPGAFFVGNVHRITKKRIAAWEVSPSGRWDGELDIRLEDLTKVVLWDPYVTNLTAIADERAGNLWAVER